MLMTAFVIRKFKFLLQWICTICELDPIPEITKMINCLTLREMADEKPRLKQINKPKKNE